MLIRSDIEDALELHDLEQIRNAFSLLVEPEPEADIDDAPEFIDLFERVCTALSADNEPMRIGTIEAINGRRGDRRPLARGATYAAGVDAAAYFTDDLF